MASRNPLSVILDQNKLTGPNYSDWIRNLKIILTYEKIAYTLDKTPPKEAPVNTTPDELEKLEKWLDHNLQVRCYMLASMSNELQRWHATVKELMTARMRDGASVHEHGIKMIGLIEKLLSLDLVISHELSTDIILLSLPSSFDNIVVNFNMNKLEATLEKLVNVLANYEATMKNEKSVFLMGSSSGSKKGPKKKGKKRSAPMKNIKPNKKLRPTKPNQSEHVCFHYNKPGHWRCNCKKYLAQKRSDKARRHSSSAADPLFFFLTSLHHVAGRLLFGPSSPLSSTGSRPSLCPSADAPLPMPPPSTDCDFLSSDTLCPHLQPRALADLGGKVTIFERKCRPSLCPSANTPLPTLLHSTGRDFLSSDTLCPHLQPRALADLRGKVVVIRLLFGSNLHSVFDPLPCYGSWSRDLRGRGEWYSFFGVHLFTNFRWLVVLLTSESPLLEFRQCSFQQGGSCCGVPLLQQPNLCPAAMILAVDQQEAEN
ncbi:hypothetical protein ZIOFF_073265 [Zingiber officinale]|uniref:Uncharacterized protein n=1 Tax=Zingiber officinale TaxID=94328 RepID=A0A8J5C4V3_ZINOF|nr:hypothetical protein ZIOFF_073265 [Zingiber officinale]